MTPIMVTAFIWNSVTAKCQKMTLDNLVVYIWYEFSLRKLVVTLFFDEVLLLIRRELKLTLLLLN